MLGLETVLINSKLMELKVFLLKMQRFWLRVDKGIELKISMYDKYFMHKTLLVNQGKQDFF